MKVEYVILAVLWPLGTLLNLLLFFFGRSTKGNWISLDVRPFFMMGLLSFLVSFTALSLGLLHLGPVVREYQVAVAYCGITLLSLLIAAALGALGLYDWVAFRLRR